MQKKSEQKFKELLAIEYLCTYYINQDIKCYQYLKSLHVPLINRSSLPHLKGNKYPDFCDNHFL